MQRRGQINFDGKLLPDLNDVKKVNRLAVVLVQESVSNILGIIKTDNSKGRTEAEAVKATLDKWYIALNIIAFCSDMTEANFGVHKGSATIL